MKLEIIKSKADYKKALQKLSELIDKNPNRGSEDENALELLLLVIKDYEQKNVEPIRTNSIEAIKFRMEQMELSRKDLIPYFGSISKVSEVLNGKRRLSLPMIRKLHEGLDIPLDALISEAGRAPERKKKKTTIKTGSLRKRHKNYFS